MNINIRGDKIKITNAIEDYIFNKTEKLNRFFENNDNMDAYVKVHAKNNNQKVEVTIPTKNFTIRAEEESDNLYTAIDLVIDKLERQITKNKSKLLKKYKGKPSFELNLDFESEEEPTKDVKIIKRKTLESKPMDEEEALLQMELVDHDFFVFKNIDEECVSVLYKRKDGKTGIINIK